MNTDQEFIIQKIRTQYTEKETSELNTLRKLDNKVKRPANVLAYILGVTGALVMGSGMSLVMTDIGAHLGIAEPNAAGIIIGSVGLLLALINYPIHKNVLNRRKQKYAGQIIHLSDSILANNT